MFLVLLRALSLLYTPSVLLGSFAIFCDQCMFLYPSKKKKIVVLDYYFITKIIAFDSLIVSHVSSYNQLVDVFTKPYQKATYFLFTIQD